MFFTVYSDFHDSYSFTSRPWFVPLRPPHNFTPAAMLSMTSQNSQSAWLIINILETVHAVSEQKRPRHVKPFKPSDLILSLQPYQCPLEEKGHPLQ